jgi:hypothetical protein
LTNYLAEVGKVILKSKGEEALSDEYLFFKVTARKRQTMISISKVTAMKRLKLIKKL